MVVFSQKLGRKCTVPPPPPPRRFLTRHLSFSLARQAFLITPLLGARYKTGKNAYAKK